MELRCAVAWADKWGMLPEGGTVLCAVSGGRDSMVLLHFLYELGRRRGFTVAAAHYNHHLRPDADRDERFVRDWTAARGIPCLRGGGDVAAYCAGHGLSIEEGARRLRYAFLEEARRRCGASVVATGHHLADQAETVLLNLLRGTGPEGLRGIAPVRGNLIRPLLDTPPEELAAYAQAHGVPWVEDETNGDPSYSRNRLRLEVLPALLAVNPAALESIHRAARTIAEEDAWVEGEARRRLEALGEPVDYGAFRALPPVLRRRVVRLLLDRLPAGRRDIAAVHIDAVARMGRGDYLSLPGGVYAAVEEGRLVIAMAEAPPPRVPLLPGREAAWGDWAVRLTEDEGAARLRLPWEGGALSVGAWDPRGRLETPAGPRSMKRIFADRRVPVSRRDGYPALYEGDRPAAILSLTEGCPPGCTIHEKHLLLDWSRTEKKGER